MHGMPSECVRVASGLRQDGVGIASGWCQKWPTYVSRSVRVDSGWRQDDVKKASKKRQTRCQEGVGEHQDSPIALGTLWGGSGWRQYGVMMVSGLRQGGVSGLSG